MGRPPLAVEDCGSPQSDHDAVGGRIRAYGSDMDVDGCRVPLVGGTMPLVGCTFADQEILFRSQPMPHLTH
jgi:hypothetical protein